MSQVSRPLLGVLIATVVGFAVWTVALKKSVTGGSSGKGATSTNTLQSAIDKAHQAVTTSNNASVAHGGTVATTPTQTITTATATATVVHATKHATKTVTTSVHASAPRTAAQREAVVVRSIEAHKLVAVLFFNKLATDDQAVKTELASIPTYKGHVVKLAIPVSELSQYPVITQQVSITGSPTLVLIDASARVTTIFGFTDRFEIGRRVAAALGPVATCHAAPFTAGCRHHA